MSDKLPKLYTDFSDWWPILSRPAEYMAEAEAIRKAIIDKASIPVGTMLELGCGGGNNASHLKNYFQMTLVDLSPEMLEISRKLNPECEHFSGDMRIVRLGRQFDAVLIHDAIGYMTSESDLLKAFETAFVHCRPGGAALFAPDYTSENFQNTTGHGGHDSGNRALRYLYWNWDSDPQDTIYYSDMVYLLRDESGQIHCEYDRHILGLFAQQTWLELITRAGFKAFFVKDAGPPDPQMPGRAPFFIGQKPIAG